MTALSERISTQLRVRICTNCVARNRSGGCEVSEVFCPLFQKLDDVVDIIGSVRDYSIEPYHARLRAVLCPQCDMDAAGHCARSQRLECALDMYFSLIVEVIESELYRV